MASDLNQAGVVGNAGMATAAKGGETLLVHVSDAFLSYAREVQQLNLE